MGLGSKRHAAMHRVASSAFRNSANNIHLLRREIVCRRLTDKREALIRLKYLQAWLTSLRIKHGEFTDCSQAFYAGEQLTGLRREVSVL